MSREATVERRHRLDASELVNKVAAAWVADPAATFGLTTREVDLLTRAAQLFANAEAKAVEHERALIVAYLKRAPSNLVQEYGECVESNCYARALPPRGDENGQ